MTFIHRSRHHVPHGKLLGKSTPALLGVWLVTVASFTHIRPGIFFIILIIRILHFSLIILWFWWYLLVWSSTSFSFQGPLGVSVITTQGQKVSISIFKASIKKSAIYISILILTIEKVSKCQRSSAGPLLQKNEANPSGLVSLGN